jgi:hypothetical protein
MTTLNTALVAAGRLLALASLIGLTVATSAAQRTADPTGFVDRDTRVLTIWHSVPFHAGGDLAQYQATMAQNRDQVRRSLTEELSGSLQKMTQSGAAVEALLEPMAQILVMFDLMHDLHKARDQARIDFSVESQLKASLDALFTANDVRDAERRIQFSRGALPQDLRAYLQGGAPAPGVASRLSRDDAARRQAFALQQQIDFLAHGSFTHVGGGDFQLTLHLTNIRNGAMRSLEARGPVGQATRQLAQKMFDLFQKNDYPAWEAGPAPLQWLAPPANPARDDPRSASFGYAFQEATAYCRARGYRLPYARELLMAESGSAYKAGGIGRLLPQTNYPVLDRRHAWSDHVLRLEDGQTSALRPVTAFSAKGLFWCVQGEPAREIMTLEKVWRLHREHQAGDGSNRDIFAAVEMIRRALGEFDEGTSYYHNTSTGERFDRVQPLASVGAALEVLRRHGIVIDLSGPMRPR